MTAGEPKREEEGEAWNRAETAFILDEWRAGCAIGAAILALALNTSFFLLAGPLHHTARMHGRRFCEDVLPR